MGQKLVVVIIVVLGGAVWWMMGQSDSAPIAQTGGTEQLTGESDDVQVTPRQYAPTQPTQQTQTQTQGTANTTGTTGGGTDDSTPAPTVTAPAPAPAPAPVAATVGVTIQNFAFGNGAVTVKKGTKLVWTNSDGAPHTVSSTQGGVPNGTFESGNLSTGGTFAFTANTPGTYTYVCKYHPSMKGTITVTE